MPNVVDLYPVQLVLLSNRFCISQFPNESHVVIERELKPARIVGDGLYETQDGKTHSSSDMLVAKQPHYDLVPELQVLCLGRDEPIARDILVSNIRLKVESLNNLAQAISSALVSGVTVVSEDAPPPRFQHR